MQPSCTEPNPRGTKGKKQEGWGKEKEKGKGGKEEGGKDGERREKERREKERREGEREEKGKASPKIIGRGYGLASGYG